MVALLAGCTSTTSGSPQDPEYDFAVFLCGSGPAEPTGTCSHAATSDEISALRAALDHDTDVDGFQYLSQRDTYLIGRHVLPPKVAAFLHRGDLPAAIWVDAADGTEPAVMSRYANAPAVSAVQSCSATSDKCSVDVLRQVGITH